jgi:hypothetical protein
LRPGGPVEGLRGGAVAAHLDVQLQLGLRLDGLGGLVFGAEVADVPLLFLRPPLGVEVDEALQERLFGQPGVPAVGVGHGGVQLVVQFFEDADQALLVDVALVCVQILPAALFLEHVVEGGHRQVVVGVEALLAVRVELRPEVADRGLL